MFWGWDTCLTVNEESKDADRMPGRAAILTVLTILLTYLLVAIAAMMYAGVGAEGLGLGNEETSDNVFGALAEPVMGHWPSLLLFLAVLTSSLASLQTTFLPRRAHAARDGRVPGDPDRFAHVHPRFQIPSYATLACGIARRLLHGHDAASRGVLADTILSLGIMICFYYGLTAFACGWYFRRELFASTLTLSSSSSFPLIGGLMLAAVFVSSVVDSFDPAYGSGAEIGGVGLVFILGVGTAAARRGAHVGWRARNPAFFRGETLHTTPLR